MSDTEIIEQTAPAPAPRRSYLHAAVTGILGVAVIALGVTLAVSHSQAAGQYSQIARQEQQIARLDSRLAWLGSEMTSVQQTSKLATKASLGLCVSPSEQLTDSLGDSYSALQSYDLTSPSLRQGVISCPSGQFLSVVPTKS